MPLREIIKEPNPLLHQRADEIPPEDILSVEIQTLIDDMLETVKTADGVGLAGPQIAIMKRIAMVHTNDGIQAIINPVITKRSIRAFKSEEGCLSIPDVFGMVKRHRRVTVEALDRNGEEMKIEADGLTSIILQHEIDHLDGVLFTDKLIKFTVPPLM